MAASPHRLTSLALASVLAICTTGCDESFTPIETSDLQFSVYGFLDATADTQWIRVMPIRPLIVTTPDRLGANVSLEDIATSRTITLQDSLFRFSTIPDVGSGGVFLHNFWTAERIDPGATYRFVVARDGAPASEALVGIPADYEVELWLKPSRLPAESDSVRLVGAKHLALVESSTVCGETVSRREFRTAIVDGDALMVPVLRAPSVECGGEEVDKQELFIAVSGAEWPSGPAHSTGNLGVPSAPSNISHSVGFLGGLLTKVVPYEHCQIERGPTPVEYCRLRFGGTSAMLTGTVTDASCGGPVTGALVELREVDPMQPAVVRVRFTEVKRDGGFAMSALEPGRVHEVHVDRATEDVLARYHAHTDTLRFQPGEQMNYDVALHRLFPC